MTRTMRIAGLVGALVAMTTIPATAGGGKPTAPVKKSLGNNKCYMPANLDYSKILKYTPFKTLKDCIKSGGQLALTRKK